jgi:hypothetical protein
MTVRISLFSVDEANRLLPRIKPELERLVTLKAEYDRLATRLEVLSVALAGAASDNPDAVEQRQVAERHRQVGGEIAAGVEGIQAQGPVVKDLDRGTVDFYAVASGDRLIFLCWDLSENEVGHWHTLEGGFAGRHPLNSVETD